MTQATILEARMTKPGGKPCQQCTPSRLLRTFGGTYAAISLLTVQSLPYLCHLKPRCSINASSHADCLTASIHIYASLQVAFQVNAGFALSVHVSRYFLQLEVLT